MALVKCPDCGRDVSDIAPSCPGCARPMGAVSAEPQSPQGARLSPEDPALAQRHLARHDPDHGPFPKGILIGIIAMLCVPAVIAAVLYIVDPSTFKPSTPKASTPDPTPTASALASPPASFADRLSEMNYANALAFTIAGMTDTVNDASPGERLFTLWASWRMAWGDVAVANDETSFAMVLKDSDEARGKRLCTSGRIVQIEVQKPGLFSAGLALHALVTARASNAEGRRWAMFGDLGHLPDAGTLAMGLLSSGGNIFKFVVAGSSGTLVERSPARICGVVTGTYDYSNSGGGTGHAITLVGMFDLPENRVPAFDKANAVRALDSIDISGCKTPGGPSGSGRVSISFYLDGSVSSVRVDEPPFTGTTVGDCIARKFRSVQIPAFSGHPTLIGKSFVLN